jgi:acetyl-CoA acetyltransferase
LPFGAASAANWIGVNASQYLHRYGADRELLGMIAVNARRNAAVNPQAIDRDPMTMEDYFAARPIVAERG